MIEHIKHSSKYKINKIRYASFLLIISVMLIISFSNISYATTTSTTDLADTTSTTDYFAKPSSDVTKEIQDIGTQLSEAENKLAELTDDFANNQLKLSIEKINNKSLESVYQGILKEKKDIEIVYAAQTAKTVELISSNKSIKEYSSSKTQLEYQAKQDYLRNLQFGTNKLYTNIVKKEKDLKKKVEKSETNLKKLSKIVSSSATTITDLTTQVTQLKDKATLLKQQFIDSYKSIGTEVLSEGRICPIAGPVTNRDDWGDARSGGRRHKGNDIFNPYGTPNVAIVSGELTQSNSGLGGKGVTIKGDDGYEYYYAHLSEFAVENGRVQQGDVVGYTGDSGNAVGGAPHTHFQIRKIGEELFNPYPTIRTLCGLSGI